MYGSGIFIVGVRKCGTSTLFDIIRRHRDVVPSSKKEPQFLSLPSDIVRNNIGWYNSLFEGKGDILLDGSTFYFSSERAWKNIDSLFEDPYIIVVLRDPAKRAYSAYLHMVKKAWPRDNRSFIEIVEAIERKSDECTSLKAIESQVLGEAIKNGAIDPNYMSDNYLRERFDVSFKSTFEDPLLVYRYFGESVYHRYFKRIKKIFGDNNVNVVVLEDLIEDPSRVIREVFDFIGLTVEEPELLTLSRKNETRMPRGMFSRGLMWLRRNSDVAGEAWKQLQSSLGPVARYLWNVVRKPKPKLSKATYARTRSLVEHEYTYWERQFDCISSFWSYD